MNPLVSVLEVSTKTVVRSSVGPDSLSEAGCHEEVPAIGDDRTLELMRSPWKSAEMSPMLTRASPLQLQGSAAVAPASMSSACDSLASSGWLVWLCGLWESEPGRLALVLTLEMRHPQDHRAQSCMGGGCGPRSSPLERRQLLVPGP